ncbi:MAG: FAD-binding oxidoreductase [Beijerinckiaceae bacterium]|nr:FAD-binding oxidoreductase [Beijerinckiaceae bacterium]
MPSSPLPDYRDPCGWNRMLSPRQPQPVAEGRIRARYAIVGAGYTGLAAARRLHELDPSADIVVLEGTEIGEGSSGRNSGFANPRDSKIGLSTTQMERAEKLNEFAAEGFAYLIEAMDRGGFSCDLEKTGRITGAATEPGAAKIRSMAEGARSHGFAHEFLDAEGMRCLIGSAYYRCGIRTEEGYLLQPAALIRGLADSLPAEIRLFENSPVLALEGGAPRRVRTAKAEIEADIVILATNAAIKHFGFWRDGLVTIYTYAGITEAMVPEDAAQLGIPAWGLLPAHRLGTTVRRVGPDRMMVRSLYAYEKPIDPARARDALTGCFHRRYPMLRHVPLEHVWGGTTALTMNGSPRWGQLGPGLYGSAGCNGSGLVKGTVLGKRLADMIVTGDPQEALQAAYGRADRIAPEPFRTLGFHVISALERRKAGAEM